MAFYFALQTDYFFLVKKTKTQEMGELLSSSFKEFYTQQAQLDRERLRVEERKRRAEREHELAIITQSS